MPYLHINQARLYYETFGEDRPGQAPILLVHGSTVTGQADWREVAPLLARYGRVIVPDCRGHGRSTNPGHSYCFRELAADMAGLIQRLGYERAHVIGHSNGGNVALVLLMEHPEVVQTAILQAANAYVSPDLVEKEPAIFDPQRVAQEDPAWMNEMITLHGATHGVDYWRELLRLTVQEIITQPNYNPVDLEKVERPVLVIEGEQDRVNAPAGHARFIARHIPHAELWIPAGTGHNVHKEIPLAWLERVFSFWQRRGDEANERLYRLGRIHYPDQRVTRFAIHAEARQAEAGDLRILQGQVLTAEQLELARQSLSPYRLESEVKVLLDGQAPWALVQRTVTDLRREPRNLSERLSQALLGEAVRILEESGDWVFVQLQADGYLGWLQASAIKRCDQSEVESYQARCNARVIAEWLPARLPDRQEPAGKLPFGILAQVVDQPDGQAAILLPGGQTWWVEASGLLLGTTHLAPDPVGIAQALEWIERFIGVPYLWGGRTPFGYDCSGLAQAFWSTLGVQLPRDADQQAQRGVAVEGDPQPGDLLFFGESQGDSPSERFASISHVAISLGGLEVIHANGSTWNIARNSLDLASPLYRAWLREHLVCVQRYL